MKPSIMAMVALGGAIGSVLRYMVSSIQSPTWTGFPYGIFIVNVSGGFVMGLLVELMALKFSASSETRAFLTTGIMGGYTTFSTFSLESALLLQRHAWGLAAGYVFGSALLSILALFCGLWLVRAVYG